MEESNFNYSKRWRVYLQERFPLIANSLLIATFTFSAISYSRICREVHGFITPTLYIVASFTTITLFYLLRVFDEHKDAADDKAFRSHLPIPRGLLKLRDLRVSAFIVIIMQITVNAVFYPSGLLLYAVVFVFLLLMWREFFVSKWLKNRPVVYALSHMFIIPLVDIYASGTDWLLDGVTAPKGLLFFFIVSYLNGLVLEVGRKIRVSENEEHNTYSTLYGANKATIIWIGLLFIDLLCSLLAAHYAQLGLVANLVLVLLFGVAIVPAILFLKKKNEKRSKMIEVFSGIWTLLMYLTLGGIPMIINIINKWS